jgi:hypothetical protein
MGEACDIYLGEQKYIQGFGRKPVGKRPLGRLRHRWENNISIGLQKL